MSPPLRVLVTGGNGQLGRDVRDVLAGAIPDGGVLPVERAPGDIEVLSTDIDNLDVVNRTAVGEAFDSFRPQVVIHGGAFTAVDACESDPDTAFAVNALGTRHVAEAARRVGAHLLYVSTDYVFDGTLDRPYLEWDTTNPQSVYGRSKLGGELEVAAVSGGDATVVRTAWVSGAHGANMVKTVLRLADATPDSRLRFVDDQHGTPTFTADLATAIVGLALAHRPGTFHVTNQGETTWFGFARATLAAAGHDPDRVEPIATGDLDPPRPAPRPANSRLDNAALRLSGLDLLPEWTASLTRLVEVLPVVAKRA
ncbi:MAG TPA: dTDP-4-dehydrorhamnose reductase [Acidimicrobiales bacterium]|nr:dTDP-4-dehydrorhamnose reductase [Acidimicrobiales bacterium]